MVTKRHFQETANIIRSMRDDEPEAARVFARHMADFFKQENPRFDRERFMKACGLEDGKNERKASP
jgi:hypothetical protein